MLFLQMTRSDGPQPHKTPAPGSDTPFWPLLAPALMYIDVHVCIIRNKIKKKATGSRGLLCPVSQSGELWRSLKESSLLLGV